MRGLLIRAKLTKALADNVIGNACLTSATDTQFDSLIDIYIEARLLGVEDGIRGESVPPLMFMRESALLGWWQDGNDTTFDLAEMDSCARCARDDACPRHN